MLVWYRAWSRRAIAIIAVSLLGICALQGETVEPNRRASAGRSVSDGAPSKTERIREGATLVAELGEFREAEGERIRFYLAGEKISFVAVENLALDRVSKVLDENTSPRTWSVSGVVTEYRGGNYLIVTRAALKARSRRKPSPRPE